ncbi:hypothetical protein LBMAG42_10860 [Deltaproteobacteria bacterium]|nr:hypothetical protein LBMAG42_10860 [Deltaproteobacteria bacterium]
MFGTLLALVSGCTLLSEGDWAQRLDPDHDGVKFPYDCDDRDATVGEEVLVYLDEDRDGHGTEASGTEVAANKCPGTRGWAVERGDCDDANAVMNTDEVEVCDGFDNNCDGEVDDGLLFVAYYLDADGDGFGVNSTIEMVCSPLEGYVTSKGDCDDTDARRGPGFVEVCDGVDNDCDGRIDEGLLVTTARDFDGDGYGDPGLTEELCTVPAGYGEPSDCDDGDPAVYPGAPEDCENGIDEGCRGFDETDTMYPDNDSDGYGVTELGQPACPERPDWSLRDGDCDDNNSAISPGKGEVCPDGIDNDCDGTIDGVDQWQDRDKDGAGDPASFKNACSLSSGWTTNDFDCNDSSSAAPRYVATTGVAGATGTAADPYPTIAAGLTGGSACLVLAPGTYAESLQPTHDVELWGAGELDETVLAGDGGVCAGGDWTACRATLAVSGVDVTLMDLTVQGGTGRGSVTTEPGFEDQFVCGGGVYIDSGSVTMERVVVQAAVLPETETGTTSAGDAYSLTSGGGGLCALGGDVQLTDTVFDGNSAELGGGVYFDGGGSLVARRVAFTENAATQGGAAWLGEGSMRFNQVRAWCNGATAGGGAYFVGSAFANVSFDYADFAWNTAGGDATELWAEAGSVVDLGSVIVVGSTPDIPALDGEGSVRARYSVGSEVAGTTFEQVWYDSTVITTADELFTPSCDGDRTNDSFVLPAGSIAIDAGDVADLDADGSRADAGSNGGPTGAW